MQPEGHPETAESPSSDRLAGIESFFDRRGDIWIGAYRPNDTAWRTHRAFRQREEHACELLRGERRGTAVDLGCGGGSTLIRLSRMGFDRVVGVDISGRMVESAREAVQAFDLAERIEVYKGDARHLENVPSASADACIALGVIEYLATDAELLSEVHRILRPGGAAVIQTQNLRCLRTGARERIFRSFPSLRREAINQRLHRPEELRRSAAEGGFKVEEELFSHFHPLFPLTMTPGVRRIVEPADRSLSRPLERFASRPSARWLASMYIPRLRKLDGLSATA